MIRKLVIGILIHVCILLVLIWHVSYTHLSDENFNVERMADILCMSRSSLLRKIKILFNLSPIDFIRLIRLKKAAELIQEGKYRIGDICYMVGINLSLIHI